MALPRVRDFRGISGKSFDGRGNYNVGVKEQIIFPRSSTTRWMPAWSEHQHHDDHESTPSARHCWLVSISRSRTEVLRG